MGGLLLFDITNRRSFMNVHNWLEEAQSHVRPHSIVFLLVGHKCDLEEQRQVSRQEAEKLAGAFGMRYVETSARDAINVEQVCVGNEMMSKMMGDETLQCVLGSVKRA